MASSKATFNLYSYDDLNFYPYDHNKSSFIPKKTWMKQNIYHMKPLTTIRFITTTQPKIINIIYAWKSDTANNYVVWKLNMHWRHFWLIYACMVINMSLLTRIKCINVVWWWYVISCVFQKPLFRDVFHFYWCKQINKQTNKQTNI